MDRKEYAEKVKTASPGSPVLKNCAKAFFAGGLICLFGEALFVLFTGFGRSDKEAAAWVSVCLIALTALLTGVGVFDKIAKHAGAGTMVPITGFANSVVSPAVEFRTEGRISGTAVKMFTIAGPVLVFGISASVLYGLVLCLVKGGMQA